MNLTALLLPNQESGEHRITEFSGLTFLLKEDKGLNRDLTLSEFLKAFRVYKDIDCEYHPQKREQMDAHETTVMAVLFDGFCHYEYHKMCAARVAAHAARGQPVDWGKQDQDIYSLCTAGKRCRTCSICDSVTHDARMCPICLMNKVVDILADVLCNKV